MTTLQTRDVASRLKLAISQDTMATSGRGSPNAISPASDGENYTTAGAAVTWSFSGSEIAVTGATGAAYALLGSTALKDGEAAVRFSVSNTGDSAGIVLRYQSSSTQYRIRYNGNALVITLDNAGSVTTLATTPVTLVAGTFYWIRARFVSATLIVGGNPTAGCALLAKFWQDGTAEPASFGLLVTDPNITSAGQFGLFVSLNAGGHSANFDHFAITDAYASNKGVGARLLLSAVTARDLTARLLIGIPHDTAGRLRLAPTQLRDLATRTRLLAGTARDLTTRLLIGIPYDLAARVPLLAVTLRGLASRLLLVAQPARDVAARLVIAPVATSDMATRLFLHAPATIPPGGAVQVSPDSSPNLAPYGGTQDLTVYKMQMVLVFGPDGTTFLDCWRDAPLLAGFKETVSAAISPLKVQLPRPWNAFDLVGQPGSRGTVAQGNVVKYSLYGPNLPQTGLLRYQGVIDTWEPAITDRGEESVVVTIVPQSSAIADRGIGGSVSFGTVGDSSTYVDPVQQFKYWFTTTDPVTGVAYLAPLTFDTGGSQSSSGIATQYLYTNQQLGSVFTTVLQMLPSNWFYRPNPSNTVTLNVPPVTAQHTLVVGQHVSNPTYKEDWMNAKNVIYSTGYTPPGATGPITAIVVSGDVATLGERLALFNDSRVQDQNTLEVLALGALTTLDQPAVRATVRVVDYRGDAMGGLGYDIETLKVGDSCVIVDATSPNEGIVSALWDVGFWNQDAWDYSSGNPVNQVVMIVGLTYAFDYVDLELATLQPSQDRALLKVQQQLQDFTLL